MPSAMWGNPTGIAGKNAIVIRARKSGATFVSFTVNV
jgi:hypothetical protein